MRGKLSLFLGAFLLLLLAGFFYKKYRIAPKLEVEKLELTDLNGNSIPAKSFVGKKVFLNFFATWCGPCVSEIPPLQEAQYALADENFQFILISDEPVERLQFFKERAQTPLLVLHSKNKLSEYNIFTLPTSYMLNKNSEVVFKYVGDKDWSSPNMLNKLKQVCAE